MKTTALIALAGSSQRTNGIIKQFYHINNQPLWLHTVNAFITHQLIDDIYLIVRQEDYQYYFDEIKKNDLVKIKKIIIGGATRSQSIKNGINAILETDYVLIHDGARPLVSQKIIDDVLTALKTNKTVLTALPSSDSVYYLEKELIPLNRDALYLAQTPQAFDFTMIKEAYNNIKEEYSDDCQVFYAYYKIAPTIIPGDKSNFKVTTATDFALLKTIKND